MIVEADMGKCDEATVFGGLYDDIWCRKHVSRDVHLSIPNSHFQRISTAFLSHKIIKCSIKLGLFLNLFDFFFQIHSCELSR